MGFNDDDAPKKAPTHEMGQVLDALSIEELTKRVTLLQEEITRLEQAKLKKSAVREAAGAFFKT